VSQMAPNERAARWFDRSRHTVAGASQGFESQREMERLVYNCGAVTRVHARVIEQAEGVSQRLHLAPCEAKWLSWGCAAIWEHSGIHKIASPIQRANRSSAKAVPDETSTKPRTPAASGAPQHRRVETLASGS